MKKKGQAEPTVTIKRLPIIKQKMDLITAVVLRGKADAVVKAAFEAGAGGATIFFARGKGIREKLRMFGIGISPEKEVVLFVTGKKQTAKIFLAIIKAGKLDIPGEGFAYIQDVNQAIGFLPS